MVFYLKVNRNEKYTFRNLQYWMEIVETVPEARTYILCDQKELKQAILEKIRFKRKAEFLESNTDAPELKEIVPHITDERWRNAGYAHLTTFYHARKNQFPSFWNIDGDDTCICLSPERICQMLSLVEAHVQEKKIHASSLDMWTTRTKGNHWSFGITYIDNQVDWFGRMKKYYLDEKIKSSQVRNVDGFFSCLKNHSDIRLETFYVENMKFIHYSDDFFKRPDVSGFFHWKDGYLILPILLYCMEIESLGRLKIPEELVRLDLGIEEKEGTNFLLSYAMESERKLLEMRK